jgi:serine/threonine protein kinase
MVTSHIEIRRKRYFQLSSQIAQLDNAQLHSLFNDGESSKGWGLNHTINLGESQVFVKRIPVTGIEYDNMFSTQNIYDLPTYYNYGVGSAGFGVFRELITHIKTTNWVLEGAIATFPLMYHYRIVPFSGQRADMDRIHHQKYIEYWNNSTNIGNYMLDRANANYELLLFLEYVPYVLETWLSKNLNKSQQILDDLHETIDFLRANEIIHFDAHFHNILTDGEQTYLTDFGLILDRNFTLTKDEEYFFEQHRFYDYGEILRELGLLIRSAYDLCVQDDKRKISGKYGLDESLKTYEFTSILLDNIEEIHADGVMELDDSYVATIIKYRSIITLMQDFFTHMRGNNKKDTIFPCSKLRLLLKETEFISSEDMG